MLCNLKFSQSPEDQRAVFGALGHMGLVQAL